ncbi:MAG: septum formation initiator family protein [bacterium]
MKKFQEKKRWREIVQSKPGLIIIGIIVVAFSWNVFGLMNRMQETAKNKKIEEEKIIELKQRKDQLSGAISSLKTEKGVEENIREKFGLAKDGEEMIIVVDDKNPTSVTKNTEPNRLFSFFKNLFKQK